MTAPVTMTLYDDVYADDGSALANTTVTCTLDSALETSTGGGLIAATKQTTTTDGVGHFTFTVIANDLLTPAGSAYIITVPSIGRTWQAAPQSANGTSQRSTAGNVLVSTPQTLAPAGALSGTYAGPADLAVRSVTVKSSSPYAPSFTAGIAYIVAGKRISLSPTGGDDGANISNALNLFGEVVLSPEAWIASQVTLTSGAKLKAKGATITQPALANKSMVVVAAGAHVGTQVSGGIWDGNGVNQGASNPVFDFSAATRFDQLLLHRFMVRNASGHGVFVTESTHNNDPKWIVGVKVIDYGLQALAFGIYGDYVGSLDIDGCFVSSALGYDGYELGHSGLTHLGLEGNMRLRGSTGIQRAVAGAVVNFPFSESAQILDMVCIGGGIWNDTHIADKVTIARAKIRACTPAAGYAGIRYIGSNGLIEGCDVEVTTLDGIALSGATSKGNQVKGNRAYSASVANSGRAFADGVAAGPTDNSFEGNIGDGANGGGFTYLIELQGTREKAHGNKVGPNGGCFNGLHDLGGSNDWDGNDVRAVFNVAAVGLPATSTYRNNAGYNPVGVVAPAVPASGVALVAVNYDRTFYVTTGAGATTMAIAGGPTVTLQASVAGQVIRVPATKTLTPTYANPPTWVVEGE